MTIAEPNQSPKHFMRADSEANRFESATVSEASNSGAPAETNASSSSGGLPPELMDTMVIKRRDRRSVHAEEHLEKLPKVPESLAGRVLCAHPEIVTAVVSLGMALVFILPSEFLTVAVMIGVLSFAYGWGQLTHLPAPRASAILILIVGLATIALARIFGDFSIIAEVVGLGIVGAFVTEMFRSPRPDLLNSVSGNIAGVLIVSTGGAWIMLEGEALWYFLLVPGALTLLGGCVGMAMSANWTIRWRVVATIFFSCLFGFLAGAAIMGLEGTARDQMVIFAGGHLPTLAAAIVSGVLLGAVIGMTFAALGVVFSGNMAPATVGAAVSQAFIPILAAGIPIYILARLLVGEGPTLT